MHKTMMTLAKAMAFLGGAVLTLLILLTCVSVFGRSLNGIFHSDFMEGIAPGFSKWMIEAGVGPVNGDFELVEAGVAFAIFAFIPLCQITSSHAAVDVFANMFPRWLDRSLRVLTEIVFAAVLVLIAWRLYEGLLSKVANGETSYLLEFPVWWAYLLSFAASIVAALVGIYMAGVRIVEFFTGKILITEVGGAGH